MGYLLHGQSYALLPSDSFMRVSVYVEVPVAVMNIIIRELHAQGVPELRSFADFLTDAWSDVSTRTALDLGIFLDGHGVDFEGISLQASERKKVQFRFRNIERKHLIRLGHLLLEWADEQVRQYDEIESRLYPVVAP